MIFSYFWNVKNFLPFILFILGCSLLPAQSSRFVTGLYYVVDKSDSATLLTGKRDTVYVNARPIITVNDFRKVKIVRQTYGGRAIQVVLSEEGGEKFGAATAQWIGKKIAIVVDGEVLSAPEVKSAILGGKLEIWGGWNTTREEMEEIKKRLEKEMKK
jgi:preprotein translocase subunit SecD